MKQIIFIHGGETFQTYEDYLQHLRESEFELPEEEEGEVKKWKYTLREELGEDTQIIMPSMPSKANAKYLEWKIWFEKVAKYAEDGVVLIGHSLGGIFLAKYLSENSFPKNIKATYLIAAPYGDENSEHSLADFSLPENLEKFKEQGGEIFIYHSKDDPVVPFSEFEKYAKALPSAKQGIFEDRGHFLQETFPELVQSIQDL